VSAFSNSGNYGIPLSEFASTVVMATMLVSIPALTLLLALLRSGTV